MAKYRLNSTLQTCFYTFVRLRRYTEQTFYKVASSADFKTVPLFLVQITLSSQTQL